MTTHSSILAWRIPWLEEPGRLQSMGSQRVGHDWATSLSLSFLSVLASCILVVCSWVHMILELLCFFGELSTLSSWNASFYPWKLYCSDVDFAWYNYSSLFFCLNSCLYGVFFFISLFLAYVSLISPSWITALSFQRNLHNSLKLWVMSCRATQDGQVIVKSSDKTCFIGEGNGNPFQLWKANSLEKTLMLGKTEGRRWRGLQRMIWLDSITDSMDNLNK